MDGGEASIGGDQPAVAVEETDALRNTVEGDPIVARLRLQFGDARVRIVADLHMDVQPNLPVNSN